MLRQTPKQLSIHSLLYNRVPENHILRRMKDAVDFQFINNLLEDTYCKYYGRPAFEPAMMVKILVLQKLYNLSDDRVIEDCYVNLAYMYFLGINPDDELPDPSLLSKFRNNRLLDNWLDEILTELVKQCVDNGLIKGNGVSIDSTHITANTSKLVPERVLKHLAEKILKTLGESIPAEVNTDIPDYKAISDPKKAKEVMRDYLEALILTVKALCLDERATTGAAVEQSERILADPKFMEQKGVRSLVDEDARVGHKDRDTTFFGYKAETIMTSEERIITAVSVGDGAYVDGSSFNAMLDQTIKSKVKVKEIYGDRAYFRADILRKVAEEEIDPIIPVSASAYRVNEELFSYNKDSDQWFCVQGNETYRRKYYENKERKQYHYYFRKAPCKACPIRSECLGKAKSVGRLLKVSINAGDLYLLSQRTKLPDFKEKFKKRAPHEGKNAELKVAHGLARARGFSLKSVTIQAKLTALAVNLKRIANLTSASFLLLQPIIYFFNILFAFQIDLLETTHYLPKKTALFQ